MTAVEKVLVPTHCQPGLNDGGGFKDVDGPIKQGAFPLPLVGKVIDHIACLVTDFFAYNSSGVRKSFDQKRSHPLNNNHSPYLRSDSSDEIFPRFFLVEIKPFKILLVCQTFFCSDWFVFGSDPGEI